VGAFVLSAEGATATLRPTGTSTSAWPNIVGAATAWEAVDEIDPHDGDTSYVEANAGNTNVVFTLPDTTIGGTINSVTAYAYVRMTGADNDAFRWIYNNGSGEVVDGTNQVPTTSYAEYSFTVPAPVGGWTQTAINSLSVGLRSVRVSNPMIPIRATQVYVVVDYTPVTPTLTVAPGANRPTAKVFRGQGATGVVADQIALTATTGQGNVDVSQIVVRGLDTVGALLTDVTGVRLYRDDGDGAYDAGDTQLGTEQDFSGNASGSTATFGSLGLTVTDGTTANIWVVYDVGASAVDGHVVGSQLNGSGGGGTNGTDITVGAGQTVTTFTNITSANSGQTIQIDAAAPTANTTNPTDGAVLTGTTKQIAGTASDGSGSGLASVQVQIQRASDNNYWNGTGWQAGIAWNNATGTASWTYVWSLDAGQNGSTTYTITARATDNVGLVGTDASPVTGVKVDNLGPSMTSAAAVDATTVDVLFNEPLAGASVAAGDFAITGGLTVSNAVLQADNVTVRLTTSAQTPSTTYTVSLPGAVNDVAGNADTNNTVDFTGFVPTPVLTVAAGADVPAAKMYVLRGATQAVDQVTLTATNGTVTVTSIAVRGSATLGNIDTEIDGVALFEDDGDNVWEPAQDTVQVGTTQSFTSGVATFSGLSYDVAVASPKALWIVYTVEALATNGNAFGSSIQTGDVTVGGSATVNVSGSPIVSANAGATLEVDAYAPITTITSPATSAVLTGASTTIQGTANDDPDGAGALTGSGVASVEVRIARSNGTWWNGSSWVGTETWVAATGTSSWTYSWTLPPGENQTHTYVVTARATDAVTNVTTVPAAATGVTVDTLGPTITSVPAVTSATEVDVVFSEALASGTIASGDFSIAGLTISNAVLQADNVTVRLTTSAQTPGQLYTVQVAVGNLTDVNGVANPATSRNFTGYTAPVVLPLHPDAFATYPLGGNANTLGNNNWNVGGLTTAASFADAFNVTGGTVASVGRNLSYLSMSTQDFAPTASSIASVDLIVNAQMTGGTSRNLTIAAYSDASGASALSSATNLVPAGGGWQTYTLSSIPDPGGDGWSVADINSLAVQMTAAAVNSTMQVDEVYFRITYYPPVGGTLAVVQATGGSAPDLPTAPEYVARGAARVIDAYEFTASGGDIPIDSITVIGLDTQNLLTTDVSAVRLFTDGDSDGYYYGDGETQLGSDATFDGAASGTGKAVFSGLNHVVTDGSTLRVWVIYVIGGAATDGDRVGSLLKDGGVLVGSGSVSGFTDITSGGSGQTLAIDAAGPTVTVTAPTASQVLTGSTTDVTGTSTDGTGVGVNNVRVRIARSDGRWYDRVSGTFTVVEAWNTVDTSDGYAAWSMPWALDAPQDRSFTYTVSARATDGLSQVGAMTDVTGVKVDNVGPTFSSAAPTDDVTIDMFLSEPIDPATIASDGSDFTVTGATVTGAVVQTGNARVRLTLAAPMVFGQPYTTSAAAGVMADPYGNLNPLTTTGFTYSSEDTAPPVMSTDASATPGIASPVIAAITWSAATDNVGVVGYRICRATSSTGVYGPIGTTAGLSFNDTTGVPGQSYWYRVTAYDAAGNESTPYPSAGSGPVWAGWTQAPHATYTASTKLCKMCHDTHEAATDTNILRDTGATPGEVGICYACHDGSGAGTNIKTGSENSFALASGHAVEAAITGGDLTNACSSCHNPHRDYATNTMLPNPTVNGVSVTAADNTWCLACHNATNDWYEGAYPSVAAPSYDATGYPVAGTFPGPATYSDPAKNAHVSIVASATVEREAGDCLYCHSSHRSASEYDSLIGEFTVPAETDPSADAYDEYATLCFTCHGTEGHYAFATPPAGAIDIQQFVNAGGIRSGHRIKTAGGSLPVGAPLPCWDCHNAHGSTRGNGSLIVDTLGQDLDTDTDAGVRQFCFTCHTSTDGSVWDSPAAAYAAVGAQTVEGLRRDGTGGNVLLLPATTGHAEADTQSCYQCHGSSYVPGGGNVHNPTGGVSGGGEPCYSCHTAYQPYMEDNTGSVTGDAGRITVYHHVLGGAAGNGDIAPNATATYPTAGTDVYCVSCHTDHNYFNATPAANLRASVASAEGTPTAATDFIEGSGYGVCVSCHSLQRTKDTANQKSDGTAATQPIAGAAFDASAHQYKVNSEFGAGNTFAADCSKCHTDEQTKTFQTSDITFGTHWSASSRLISAFGLEATETAGQWHCYGCHAQTGSYVGAKTTDGYDYYGAAGAAMSSLAERVFDAFDLNAVTSTHPLGTSTSGEVVCENCHNPHTVQAAAGNRVSNPEDTLDLAAYSTASEEAAFCLNCHDGSGVTAVNDGSSYVPKTVTMVDAADDKSTYAARGHWSANGAISAGELVPCKSCHDNHGSNAPKLLGEYDAATGYNFIGSTQITANNNTVCAACHTAATADFPAGETQRDAVGYLDTGTWPGMARYTAAYTPATHTGSPHTSAQAIWPSSGYAAGDCKNCHDVHGTSNPYDELVGTFDPASTDSDQFALCFTCHKSVANGGVGTDIKSLYPPAAGGTSTDARSGHRIVTSVAGAKLAAGDALPCYDCHNPHGTAGAYSLQVRDIGDSAGEIDLSTADGIRKFCFACHVPQDTANGWSGSAWTAVGTATVEGIRRDGSDGSVLKVPTLAGAGHKQADTQSCYSCHGGPTSMGANNVHNPTGGESSGGADCFSCHSYQSMQSSSGFHHYMTSDSAASYPSIADPTTLATTDARRTCLTCHVDHDYFIPANADAAHTDGRAQNFRSSVAVAPNMSDASTYVNYDYSDADAGDGGVCTSCHKAQMTKNTAGRNTSADRGTSTVPVSDAIYDISAHNYMATAPDYFTFSEAATFTTDSSAFAVNCGKCHNDTMTKQFQNGTWKFGLHDSDIAALQTDNGQAAVATEPEEQLCYLCHSRADEAQPNNPNGGTGYSGDAPDMYGGALMAGAMMSDSLNIKGMFGNAAIVSSHPVTGDGSTTARVECANCHNPHKTEADIGFAGATGVVQDPDNTLVGSGVDGDEVYYLGPATSAELQANAAFCLACHDGTPPAYVNDGTAYVPYDVFIPAADATAMNKNANSARSHWAITGAIDAGEEVPCASCHDKHGSTLPKLLGNAIDPTASPTIAGSAVTGNNNSVCAACHSGASTNFPAGESQRDAAGYLDTGTWPGTAVYNTAYVPAAHTGSPHTATEATNGYAAGDCKNCHNVHGTAYKYDETVANFDPTSTGNDEFALCFTCHDGTKGTDIKSLYPASAGGTSVNARSGHRIVTSVAGAKLAAGDALPCYDCHNPHGSGSAYSLQVRDIGDSAGEIDLSTAGGVRNFCFACHATADTTEGWSGSAWAAVGTTTVEGFRRDGSDASVMKLPNVTGHRKADAQSCYSCHGGPTSSSSANVHNPTGGVSAGGSDCYACHGEYQLNMEDGLGSAVGGNRALSYHHVLGSATNEGDKAFAAGSYPTSATDVYCMSCHVDHDKFNSAKASNLRPDIATTNPAGAATDYNSTSNSGVCTACHVTSLTKQNPGTDQKSDGSTATPKIVAGGAANQFGASAHDYYATSTFEAGTFSANCSKCHNDEQGKAFQTSANTFGTHWSATRRVVSAFGGTQNDPLQEAHCYECHSRQSDGLKTTNLQDNYGATAMTAASERVYAQFGLASKHPVVAAGGDSVECESCHNPHVVTATTGKVTDPENGYNTIAYATDANQAAFCLKCHDGSLPSYAVNGTTYVPYTVTQANTAINNKVDTAMASKGHWTDSSAAGGSISAAETVSCAECHDNHGSAAPKLLGAYDITDSRNEINGAAITANDKTVCAACHTGATTGFPLATKQTGTGYPIAGVWPGMTVYNTAWNNTTHAGSPHTTANGGGSSSLPAYVAGDCKVCHDVHGTINTYDELRPVASAVSFDNDTFTLCFDCHDTDGPAARNVKTYYPAAVGGSGGGSGHTIRTAGGNLPVGGVVPCYDCHNAHGSASSYSLLVVTMTNSTTTVAIGDAAGEINMSPTRSANDVRNFCFSCHTSSNSAYGWNGSALAIVGAGAKVEGLDRTTGTRLRLPTRSGHASGDTQSCYQCHGNDYSGLSTNNVHNPSGGVSTGGQDCYGCHSTMQTYMEDGTGAKTGASRATVYHHVLGSATNDGDRAFPLGGYPTSTTDVFCLSCHVDHGRFTPTTKSSNLRGDFTSTPSVASTDWNNTNGGICLSCHALSLAKDTTGNRKSDGRTATPVVASAKYNASAHQYAVTSSFSDGTSFSAQCSKCHNDENNPAYKDFQTSTYRFGPHWSASQHIVSALGGTVVDELQENHCYRCHSRTTDGLVGTKKTVANRDWYNATAMTTAAERVYAQFQLASKHPVVAASGDSVECESCHNPHVVDKTTGKLTDPDNGYNAAAYATDANQATFCLKCHDGGLPARTINGTTYIPYSVTQANTAINNKSANAARGHWSITGAIGSGEEVSCAECHDNHGSAAPKLLGAYDMTDSRNEINGVAITANDNSVCTACHAAATGTTYTRLANGYPNIGTWPGTTVYNGTNGIHKGVGVVWPSSGLTGGDCKNCHDVHGTAYTYDETVGQFNPASAGNDRYAMCFTCHDADGPSTRNIKRYFPTADGGLATGGNFGHVIKTSGGTLTVGQGLPCYDCHNPHGSAIADGLLVMSQNNNITYAVGDAAGEINMGTAAGNRQFCFLCHSTADATARVTDPTDGAGYVNVAGTALVEGLNRAAAIGVNKLRLPAVSGHYEADATSCYGCHGNDYSGATTNNVHNPGAGGSTGGSACNTCHATHATMTNDTLTYHHVLDGTAFRAPNATNTYPTSTSALECVSCHVDHNYFNSQKAFNLRTDLSATAVPTNSDFPGGGTYGICIACHSVTQAKNTTGQKVGGSTTTPIISGAGFDASAHDYQVNSGGVIGFGTTAADTFKANCSKCHDDDMDTGSKMTSTYKIGVHKSSENRIAKALGVALAGSSTSSEENLCYKCHTGGTAGPDGYGAGSMSAAARSIYTEFNNVAKPNKHPVAATSGVHQSYNEGTSAGWNPASSRHVECEDCHNVHEAQAGTTAWPTNQARRGNTPPPIAGATKGVWGVTISGANANGTWTGSGTSGSPTAPTYSRVASSSYQWQLCLKCHSSWSYTTTPPNSSLNLQGQTGGKQTDVGADFNPMQLSYHPIFTPGLNQPATNLNGAWASNTRRKWIDLDNDGVNDGTSETNNNGLSNTFTDGWVTTSIVVCTDCHNNSDATGPEGPHASANKWILSGVDVNVKSTLQDGTVVTNVGYASANFCINCHRIDVYGTNEKAGLNATSALLSRMNHGRMSSSCYATGTFNSAALTWSSCLHCHGGRKTETSYNNPANTVVQNGAIHGTSMTYHPSAATYTGAANYMGQRFMNGASWTQHLMGKTTTTVGCYNFSKTIPADNYSACTKHVPSEYTELQYSY
jgi:predicted CXXCH cytochrome family protein